MSRQPDLHLFLDRLTSRTALSADEREAILQLPTFAAHVDKNRDFVCLGERVEHACFLLAGLVGRFGQNGQGDRQITALHIRGDMPDLHSVVQPTAGSALQALAPTTILRVPHSAMHAAIRLHPAIGEAFWRDCAVDATITAQWVVNVGRRDARARIAHLICEMAWRSRADIKSSPVAFTLPMTQAHLADATGMSPVHVNRSLRSLQDDGVDFSNGRVRIKDWRRLAVIGDFEPEYLQTGTGRDQTARQFQLA